MRWVFNPLPGDLVKSKFQVGGRMKLEAYMKVPGLHEVGHPH